MIIIIITLIHTYIHTYIHLTSKRKSRCKSEGYYDKNNCRMSKYLLGRDDKYIDSKDDFFSYESVSPRVSLQSTKDIDASRSSGTSYLPFSKVPLSQRKEPKERKSPFQIPSVRQCVFCDKNDKKGNGGNAGRPSKFVEHPYCISDYRLIKLYLCSKCNENWYQYRQNAEDGNYLILDGEDNEEICKFYHYHYYYYHYHYHHHHYHYYYHYHYHCHHHCYHYHYHYHYHCHHHYNHCYYHYNYK